MVIFVIAEQFITNRQCLSKDFRLDYVVFLCFILKLNRDADVTASTMQFMWPETQTSIVRITVAAAIVSMLSFHRLFVVKWNWMSNLPERRVIIMHQSISSWIGIGMEGVGSSFSLPNWFYVTNLRIKSSFFQDAANSWIQTSTSHSLSSCQTQYKNLLLFFFSSHLIL